MRSVSDVVKRQFVLQLEMIRSAVAACPDDAFAGVEIGPREHLYHALVGMDVWLSEDPEFYPFDLIVDMAASELEAPACDEVSRAHLADFVDLLTDRVDALPEDDEDFLEIATLRGREFTLLDRCITQFRHVQHHLGVFNEMMRMQGLPTVGWSGYGEGESEDE